MRTWKRQGTAGLLALQLAACGSSQTLHQLQATPSPKQEITIWTGGASQRLHGVRLTTDSMSGIPLAEPLSCHTCRRTYRRANIDSVGVRRTDQGVMFVAMLPFVALVGGMLIWRSGDRD